MRPAAKWPKSAAVSLSPSNTTLVVTGVGTGKTRLGKVVDHPLSQPGERSRSLPTSVLRTAALCLS